MRIVFLTLTSVLSGGDRHLIDLIQRLDRSKIKPSILCFGRDPYSRVVNDQLRLGIEVETGLVRTNFFQTWRDIRRKKPNVVVLSVAHVSRGSFVRG